MWKTPRPFEFVLCYNPIRFHGLVPKYFAQNLIFAEKVKFASLQARQHSPSQRIDNKAGQIIVLLYCETWCTSSCARSFLNELAVAVSPYAEGVNSHMFSIWARKSNYFFFSVIITVSQYKNSLFHVPRFESGCFLKRREDICAAVICLERRNFCKYTFSRVFVVWPNSIRYWVWTSLVPFWYFKKAWVSATEPNYSKRTTHRQTLNKQL